MRRPAGQPDHIEGGADAAVRDRRSARCRSAPSATAWRGGSASAAARPVYWWRPCAGDRPSAQTRCRSAPRCGRRRSPAGQNRHAAAARRSRANRLNGATRGDTPPSHSASAAAKDCRSSVSVSPPIIAASNSPSGFSARRICASTPGRSLTNCSASADTARSSDSGASASGSDSRSGSATGVSRSTRPASALRELLALGADVGRRLELPEHRVQPLRHIFGDAIEQECRGLTGQRTSSPLSQQGAVEQARRGGRVRGHGRGGTPVSPLLAIQHTCRHA